MWTQLKDWLTYFCWRLKMPYYSIVNFQNEKKWPKSWPCIFKSILTYYGKEIISRRIQSNKIRFRHWTWKTWKWNWHIDSVCWFANWKNRKSWKSRTSQPEKNTVYTQARKKQSNTLFMYYPSRHTRDRSYPVT